MKYKSVIGLEVHVELKTKSKMFCSCSADYFGKKPNTLTCPVCLGLPGALPVPNKLAVEMCIKIGLALNCKVNLFSKFDRKNYFYPDLAKGYQISQYDLPFSQNGEIEIDSKKIRIRRVHMEEDTAKLTHAEVNNEKVSLIDFNRSGVPLVEIVTEPDFDNATDVKKYLQKLQQIVRYLDASNADMEKGDMRLEPNISLTINPKTLPNYKVEVKNINSFTFVEKAINFEVKRQEEILERGETPVQETRGWDSVKSKTFSQRVKEDAEDYRYFPDPDIPPIRFTSDEISKLKKELPELPDQKRERFIKDYTLSEYDSEILTRDRTISDKFENLVAKSEKKVSPKELANVIINKKVSINDSPQKILDFVVSSKTVTSLDESKLEETIDKVLNENQKAIADYKKGNINAVMFLIGQVKKIVKENIDTGLIKEKLEKKLNG